MNTVWIAVAAFLGALLVALLGWIDSDEPFKIRKFIASAVRGLIAGAIFAATCTYSNGLSGTDILYAFLGGAGIDVVGHRAAGTIKMIRRRG